MITTMFTTPNSSQQVNTKACMSHLEANRTKLALVLVTKLLLLLLLLLQHPEPTL
jgi:hypothetical protein